MVPRISLLIFFTLKPSLFINYPSFVQFMTVRTEITNHILGSELHNIILEFQYWNKIRMGLIIHPNGHKYAKSNSWASCIARGMTVSGCKLYFVLFKALMPRKTKINLSHINYEGHVLLDLIFKVEMGILVFKNEARR